MACQAWQPADTGRRAGILILVPNLAASQIRPSIANGRGPRCKRAHALPNGRKPRPRSERVGHTTLRGPTTMRPSKSSGPEPKHNLRRAKEARFLPKAEGVGWVPLSPRPARRPEKQRVEAGADLSAGRRTPVGRCRPGCKPPEVQRIRQGASSARQSQVLGQLP